MCDKSMTEPRSLLLPETAEIALTMIKRNLEPRLMDEHCLRRVSAPLYLPASSPLLDKQHPGVRAYLPKLNQEVEFVGGLDSWLRRQLTDYDIAAGFGVYAIMNAVRPDEPITPTTSPHVPAWVWQQAITNKNQGHKTDNYISLLSERCKQLYNMLTDVERMILNTFPHLTATLPGEPHIVETKEAADKAFASGNAPEACIIIDRSKMQASIVARNEMLGCKVVLAEVAIFDADDIAGTSIGGAIYRHALSMQILHLAKLLQ